MRGEGAGVGSGRVLRLVLCEWDEGWLWWRHCCFSVGAVSASEFVMEVGLLEVLGWLKFEEERRRRLRIKGNKKEEMALGGINCR